MRIFLEGPAETLFGFKFFWAKHVIGFDNTKHCARCLKGSYEKLISVSMPLNKYIEIPQTGDALYICGVASPYKWANNFHLALQDGDGIIERVLYNGIKLTAIGKELEFDAAPAFIKYQRYGKEFTTCRNFQFGVWFYENH
jgi:hypothetical protein